MPRPVRQDRNRDEVRARADELHEAGMPFQMAMAVAHGRLPLNDALERLARQVEVDKLMERHELSRALATQVAMGHVSLEKVLRTRRLEAHRAENRLRTCLVQDAPLTMHLFGKQKRSGAVSRVDPYGFDLTTDDGVESFHKLQAKFAYDPADWKRVRKALKTDKALSKAPQEPQKRPQDRYGCSDRRLFRYVDSEAEVLVTLLEGEVLRGVMRWFGRYEIGLEVKGGVHVTCFRHAFADLKDA